MAHAPAATPVESPPQRRATLHAAPVTPGKVAMWLFLATEIMFFTGLIGSYIVLRSGSPPTAYSNLFPPATDLSRLEDHKGVLIQSVGPNHERVTEIVRKAKNLSEAEAEQILHMAPHALLTPFEPDKAEALLKELESAGATAEIEGLKTYNWPKPYDQLTNPLSIDLTAVNTFILICSSVTMVLALSAIQDGNKQKMIGYLAATVLIGSTFLGIQVFEYYELMFGHHYPPGISATHHFRPAASLFGSCFFTMTGFHGAHVAGGVILLTCILIGALMGKFTQHNHSPVELAGLYWHFVDLVWIILFTVVYLI